MKPVSNPFVSFVSFLTTILCTDHDRPLSKAGETDAIKVTYKLQQLGWIPELILSR